MLIGLISDTHIPEAGPALWPQVYEALEGVDLILHGGDLHVLDVLDWLERLAPVYAARGNGDDGGGGRPVCPEDPRRLRENWVLNLEGFRIGLTHDLALPEWPPFRTLESIMDHRFGGRCDIIVHGDTHVAEVTTYKGVLLVNPGSPVYPRNLDVQLGTVGFLELKDGRARAWLEQLTD